MDCALSSQNSCAKVLMPNVTAFGDRVFEKVFVVQLLSHVCLSATPWTAARQASLTSTVSQDFPRFVSIESVMLSDHLILCHPLLLLPSVFPSIMSFPVRQLFASGGQGIGASPSVLPMNIQG